MILQLDPPLYLDTPKGRAVCHVMIDYGPEHHVLWGCFVEATGECWWTPNPDIRLAPNWSEGRKRTSPIVASAEFPGAPVLYHVRPRKRCWWERIWR